MMGWKTSIVKFIRWLLRTYKKEAKKFVEFIIDEAYRYIDREAIDKLEEGVRKQVKNEVVKQIIIQGIDIYTPKGKDAVENLVKSYINKFTQEG